jgi:hypothetical protein
MPRTGASLAVTSLVAALLVARGAIAVPSGWSIIADDDCTTGYDAAALGAELYGWKVKADGTGYTDLLADLSFKVGAVRNVGGATVTSSPSWSLPPNWRLPEDARDVVFALITLNDGRLAVSSGDVGLTGGDHGFVSPHVLGHGIPARWGVRGGRDLAPVALAGNAGIHFAFAPVPEVTGGAETYGVGCHVGGLHPDPNTGLGLIAGYNVYRLIGTAAVMPTPADVLANATDGDPGNGGWVYLAPLGTFDFAVGDPGGPGAPAPADRQAWTDLVGLDNPDREAYTGDDLLILQDSPRNPDGTPRATGDAPVVGNGYWYAVQPVVASPPGETIPELAGVTLGSAAAWTVVVQDLVPGGGPDAADLDGDGQVELFSPQADLGLGGYGLTNGSLPLLSPPVFVDWQALAAGSTVSLSGWRRGRVVHLALATANEPASVAGYDVYRGEPPSRRRVGDAPVPAASTEGALYQLVDELCGTDREAPVTVLYTVDVLFSDGSPARTVGPFEVRLDASRPGARPPGRRHR